MATKTISLSLDAYERLCMARRHAKESSSSVLRRAHWDEAGPLRRGGEILGFYADLKERLPEACLGDDALDALDRRSSEGRTARSQTRWGV
jgi:hypothetical protein